MKSWGRSRGPSGTLALPRPAALLWMAGSGRAALMALDALVLRRRLPWSPVFWNLRTRSSAKTGLASTPRRITQLPPECFFVPDDPLESSDMLDPDRSGTLVDSMVRVAVRGCVAMASSTARGDDPGNGGSAVTRCLKSLSLSRAPRWSPSVELGHRGLLCRHVERARLQR